MTETIAGSSGFIRGRNRLTWPSGSTRNFSKFHSTRPAFAVDVLGLGQLLVERRRLLAVHADLVEHRESDAPRHRAVLEDVVHLRQLLQELVAREGEHVEAARTVLLLQLLELFVLRRQSAAGRDVDDEQNLPVVVGQCGFLPSAVVNGMLRMSMAVASVIPTG